MKYIWLFIFMLGLSSLTGVSPDTIYCDVSADDGSIENYGSTWSSVRGASSGSSSTTINSSIFISAIYGRDTYFINRGFLRYDTSSIPSGVTIDSVLFYCKTPPVGGSKTISIQEGTQGSTITTDDFDAFTGSSLATINLNAGSTWFNATITDCSFLNISGYSYLCIREYDHDYQDDAPTSSVATYNIFSADSSDDTYIVVYYSELSGCDWTIYGTTNVEKIWGIECPAKVWGISE
jgi:hypothetical protein